MAEITQIVERLNAPPFSRGFTLVSRARCQRVCRPPHPPPPPSHAHAQVTFDEKVSNPVEALQLLNDVFAELDRSHRVDAREEPADVAAGRLVTFLQVLKYPLPSGDL
jgi:hypothetical protein